MNSKKVNWLFLCITLIDLIVRVLMTVVVLAFDVWIGIVENLLLSQLIILLPALIFALTSIGKTKTGNPNELLGFRKIKISSFFMVILFTILLQPMSMAINAISMLFVDNAVSSMSEEVLQMPFPVMLFMIAMFGPFSEEVVFRGIIFRGYKNSGPVVWSVFWSALLFGLMHLNFNQAAYAFALGIMFALLVEATGSLWSSVIAHMLFNMPSVCMIYLSGFLGSDIYSAESSGEILTQEALLMAIGPFLIAAVISTSLAFCVLVWLAKNENREEKLRSIWICRKEKTGYLVTIPLIVAIVLCLAYMSMEIILTR